MSSKLTVIQLNLSCTLLAIVSQTYSGLFATDVILMYTLLAIVSQTYSVLFATDVILMYRLKYLKAALLFTSLPACLIS